MVNVRTSTKVVRYSVPVVGVRCTQEPKNGTGAVVGYNLCTCNSTITVVCVRKYNVRGYLVTVLVRKKKLRTKSFVCVPMWI